MSRAMVTGRVIMGTGLEEAVSGEESSRERDCCVRSSLTLVLGDTGMNTGRINLQADW